MTIPAKHEAAGTDASSIQVSAPITLIDINELVRRLSVAKGTLYNRVYLRRIPFVKAGRCVRLSAGFGSAPSLLYNRHIRQTVEGSSDETLPAGPGLVFDVLREGECRKAPAPRIGERRRSLARCVYPKSSEVNMLNRRRSRWRNSVSSTWTMQRPTSVRGSGMNRLWRTRIRRWVPRSLAAVNRGAPETYVEFG